MGTSETHYNHKGHRLPTKQKQLQNSFVADEDFRGWNVLPLAYLLREVFKVPRVKV